MPPALDVFKTRHDLAQFGPNGLLLYALQLRFEIDDIVTVAATALTDDTKDQKCDLLYLDDESRTAVIAQAYLAADTTKTHAPPKKAADLAIAVGWILGNERPEALGVSLRSAAEDLHNALEAGEIDAIELWYSHNLPESNAAREQLERAARTTRALLRQHYPELEVEVRFLEVGRNLLEEWYRSSESPILVTDKIDVPTSTWVDEHGDGWQAVLTSVPATWLSDLNHRYGDRLFSANVRSYMPSRRTAQNINYNMEQTARLQPARFWAFNNGVTALVSDMSKDSSNNHLAVTGISVVNGAQTTGALAKVSQIELREARVMIRFVKASNAAIIDDIIKYNNSQNPIKPSDFRSSDRHQERLRREFKEIPDVTYLGARRGGQEDRARRPSNLIASDTAAQALAAFHQDPEIAYHDLRSIWESDEVYARYFSDHTTAAHIVFCYSLLRAIQQVKFELSAKAIQERTQEDNEILEYLRRRGSAFLLVAAVAACAETYLNRAIADSFSISFGPTTSPAVGVEYWTPLVESLLPFASNSLDPVFDNGGLRRREVVKDALNRFRSLVSATKKANSIIFDNFRMQVVSY